MECHPHSMRDLLIAAGEKRPALKEVYELLPPTHCQRRARCCSLLPEMTGLEALATLDEVIAMEPGKRRRLTEALVHYFMTNAVQLGKCPFLRGRDCLIYRDRSFGCRAYGLWSRGYYQHKVEQSQKAKQYIRRQWQKLGIDLPGEVLEFQVPYCDQVAVAAGYAVDDEMVLHAEDTLEMLSQQLGEWHQTFRDRYFADFSYLVAAMIFGPLQALNMKVAVSRELISEGRSSGLDEILATVTEPWAQLY